MEPMLNDTLLYTKSKLAVSPMRWHSARTIACRIYVTSGTLKYGLIRRDNITATDEELVELIGEPPYGAPADYIEDTGLMDI